MYWWVVPNQVKKTTLVGVFCGGIIIGIAGIKLGLIFVGSVWVIAAVALMLSSYRKRRINILFMFMAGLMLGGWQGSNISLQNIGLKQFIGQEITVKGEVAEDIILGKNEELQVRIKSISINNTNYSGTMRLSLKTSENIKRGDAVAVAGKVKDGFGGDSITINYATLLAHTEINDPIIALRDNFAKGVKSSLTAPGDSLGLGFLLGQRTELPKELDDAMRGVGLTHIVVASGYNLTILIRASRRLLSKYSKYLAFTSSMGLMLGFVSMTGFSPSMSRAAIVTGLSLTAWYYGRKIHPVVLLLFAAALTAMINPFFVWTDAGWYLSFLAFAGVLILAPLISKTLFSNKQPALITQVALETIVAQLLTLPFVLWMFGDFAVLALVANLLVVPLVPFVMLGTFLAGIFAMVVPGLGYYIGLPTQLVLEYMMLVISSLSSLSWSMLRFPISIFSMIVLYLSVITFIVILWRKTKYNFLSSQITD